MSRRRAVTPRGSITGPLGSPVLDAFNADHAAPLPAPWGAVGVHTGATLKVAGLTALSGNPAAGTNVMGSQRYALDLANAVENPRAEVWAELAGATALIAGSAPNIELSLADDGAWGMYRLRLLAPNRLSLFAMDPVGADHVDDPYDVAMDEDGIEPFTATLLDFNVSWAYGPGCCIALVHDGDDLVLYTREPTAPWVEVNRAVDATWPEPGLLGLACNVLDAGTGVRLFGGFVESEEPPPEPIPPTNLRPPAIAGVPMVGRELEALAGVWGGDLPLVVVSDWLDAATDATLAPVDGPLLLLDEHEGMTLLVREAVSNAAGQAVADSDPVGPIEPASGGEVTPPPASSLAALARREIRDALVEAGIPAVLDAGAFYPQPTGVLVGLPTLVSRGLASSTFEVPVLVVSGDPLNVELAVDRLYALADRAIAILVTDSYAVASYRSSANAEPLPALELTVTVTLS